jgi:tetratricopeptide (TPR) repeat protein
MAGLSSSAEVRLHREDVIAGYGWVARYTLNFLDAYLKHAPDAMAFLKRTPTENGVPNHWMSVEYRAAKGLPATLDSFRAELGRKGFDDAAELYAAMHKEDRNFKLEEQDVDSWGHDLLGEGHLPQAIALFNLNVQNYPDSSRVYDSLGDAYTKSGQRELAIDNYKKAIERNPDNEHAKQRLREIDKGTTNAK